MSLSPREKKAGGSRKNPTVIGVGDLPGVRVPPGVVGVGGATGCHFRLGRETRTAVERLFVEKGRISLGTVRWRAMGAEDWSRTPGHGRLVTDARPLVESPQSSRTTVSLCVASNFPSPADSRLFRRASAIQSSVASHAGIKMAIRRAECPPFMGKGWCRLPERRAERSRIRYESNCGAT